MLQSFDFSLVLFFYYNMDLHNSLCFTVFSAFLTYVTEKGEYNIFFLQEEALTFMRNHNCYPIICKYSQSY